MDETRKKPKDIGQRVLSIALVILGILCLLIVLWVVMIVTRLLVGLG